MHEITEVDGLISYIGYFCLIWFIWALIGLFDARFITDSVLQRVARAGHLGVFVGFGVVGGNFHLSDQHDHATYQTIGFCLSVSRFVLAIQYASIAWHIHGYVRTKRPIAIMAAMNLACSMIYLGVGFAFHDHDSYVYLVWYILAVIELMLNVGLSLVFDVLSFKGTHLLNRMVLLTFIIIGEGVITLCHGLFAIVETSGSWSMSFPFALVIIQSQCRSKPLMNTQHPQLSDSSRLPLVSCILSGCFITIGNHGSRCHHRESCFGQCSISPSTWHWSSLSVDQHNSFHGGKSWKLP